MTQMYEIVYTQSAILDLQWFSKNEQNQILDGIDKQLKYQPNQQTRNRKPMHSNPYATWELRIGYFRILYNIDSEVYIVEIQKVGQKRGNLFFFRGQGEQL